MERQNLESLGVKATLVFVLLQPSCAKHIDRETQQQNRVVQEWLKRADDDQKAMIEESEFRREELERMKKSRNGE